jgi:uncharacterized protein YdhG (YjbR/CyaY superfamily)
MNPKKQFETIDDYIAQFPTDVRELLFKIRQTIQAAAPAAEETISYQMPAFRLNGILVYFAAFKNHIGFFPTSSPITAFQKELSPYETSKGGVKFPIGQPILFALIRKIVEYRVKQNTRATNGKN